MIWNQPFSASPATPPTATSSGEPENQTEILAVRLAQGGAEAFWELFDKFGPRLEAGCLQLSESWSPLPLPGRHLSEQTVEELSQLLPNVEPKAGLFTITGSLRQHALNVAAMTGRDHRFGQRKGKCRKGK